MAWYTSRQIKRSQYNDVKKFFLRAISAFFATFVVVGWAWFRIRIINKLPNIEEIQNFDFKQATKITDRNGVVLYRMFEENRQYVPYNEISPHFVNWLVATEDQRFRENVGIDPIGMLRAWFTDITQWKTHGASTLTQQLIKLIMLNPEKKIERKLKEVILAVKLSGYIKKDISASTKWLSDKEVDKKVKEKIMELYSNLIFLGNNAYGIEAAAQTYFAKKAKDISILEAAILAWMPQAPSRYDPFTNRALLMGEVSIQDAEKNPVEMTDYLRSQFLTKVQANIENSRLTNQKDDQATLDFLSSILNISLQDESWVTYQVTYTAWRKDVVLARMFEEGYITEFELKKAIIDGLFFEFTRWSTDIKAPHFVFRIINQLQQQYSQEVLQKWGLTVVTTLDYEMQQMAESSILENKEKLISNKANNSSLIYADSQNGDILAYVWSIDYNDETIDGQVDMIQASRQPWSTVKPLLYALWFMKLALSIDSPIYDIRMKIGEDEPNNADWWFWWLTTIRQALAGSRNIPAIKMFFSVWWEQVVKSFFTNLWISNLQSGNKFYGYPLAIWASEIKMLDLTNAYMHLSAMGKPAKINPILEIRWPDNSLLYKKNIEPQEQVIPTWVAYLVWKILSDNANLPPDWVRQFTAPGKLVMATKSWTTNIVKWEEKLPRDWWLMTYTPSKVLWLRWWNTDGTAMHKDAYGWWLNSGIRKLFLNKLLEKWYIQNETVSPTEIKEVVISKLSWKLAGAQTPLAFTQKSLAYLQTAPVAIDANASKIDIDTLCNGTPSELTPPQDISTARYISPESIMPDKRDASDIMNRWSTVGIEKYKESVWPILLQQLTGSCAPMRQGLTDLGDTSLNIIKPLPWEKVTRTFSLRHQSNSSHPIKTVKVFLGEQELKLISYKKSGTLNDITTITIPENIPAGSYELKLIVIDEKWYSDSKALQIVLTDSDSEPPYLMDTKVQIEQTAPNSYTIALLFADESSLVKEGSITQNNSVIKEFNGNIVQFTVNDLTTPVSWSASDSSWNKWSGTITLTKYKIKKSNNDTASWGNTWTGN